MGNTSMYSQPHLSTIVFTYCLLIAYVYCQNDECRNWRRAVLLYIGLMSVISCMEMIAAAVIVLEPHLQQIHNMFQCHDHHLLSQIRLNLAWLKWVCWKQNCCTCWTEKIFWNSFERLKPFLNWDLLVLTWLGIGIAGSIGEPKCCGMPCWP